MTAGSSSSMNSCPLREGEADSVTYLDSVTLSLTCLPPPKKNPTGLHLHFSKMAVKRIHRQPGAPSHPQGDLNPSLNNNVIHLHYPFQCVRIILKMHCHGSTKIMIAMVKSCYATICLHES